MATLTFEQGAAVLIRAGFRGERAVKMLAIATAESGRDTAKSNTQGNTPPGSRDRGWLMINDYWHKEVSNSCAFSAKCSAKEAFRISGGGRNFGQWRVYTSGAWRVHEPAARSAVRAVEDKDKDDPFWETIAGDALDAVGNVIPGFGGLSLPGRPDIPNPIEAIDRFFGSLLDPRTWIRIAQVGGGGVLMVLGLLMLAREQAPRPVKAAVAAATRKRG